MCHQVTWTWRGSSWLMATQSAWTGCASAMTAVRRWSWRRRQIWRRRSVCSDSSCRSSLSLLSQRPSRGTYYSYTKVCDQEGFSSPLTSALSYCPCCLFTPAPSVHIIRPTNTKVVLLLPPCDTRSQFNYSHQHNYWKTRGILVPVIMDMSTHSHKSLLLLGFCFSSSPCPLWPPLLSQIIYSNPLVMIVLVLVAAIQMTAVGGVFKYSPCSILLNNGNTRISFSPRGLNIYDNPQAIHSVVSPNTLLNVIFVTTY